MLISQCINIKRIFGRVLFPVLCSCDVSSPQWLRLVSEAVPVYPSHPASFNLLASLSSLSMSSTEGYMWWWTVTMVTKKTGLVQVEFETCVCWRWTSHCTASPSGQQRTLTWVHKGTKTAHTYLEQHSKSYAEIRHLTFGHGTTCHIVIMMRIILMLLHEPAVFWWNVSIWTY